MSKINFLVALVNGKKPFITRRFITDFPEVLERLLTLANIKTLTL